MGSMFTPADEARHDPSGSPWWEGHRLVAVATDGLSALAMQVSVVVSGSRHSASFHCGLFRSGRPAIVIAEDDIRAPESRWEFRSSGIWVDTICETPFEHWTYGLEAFGLEIADPAELLGRGYGDRVPLGWELDFEATPGAATPASAVNADSLLGYSQSGTAHGLVLSAIGEEDFAGTAVRQHWWGSAAVPDATVGLHQLDDAVNAAVGDGSGEVIETVALPISAGEDGATTQWWLSWLGDRLQVRTVAE